MWLLINKFIIVYGARRLLEEWCHIIFLHFKAEDFQKVTEDKEQLQQRFPKCRLQPPGVQWKDLFTQNRFNYISVIKSNSDWEEMRCRSSLIRSMLVPSCHVFQSSFLSIFNELWFSTWVGPRRFSDFQVDYSILEFENGWAIDKNMHGTNRWQGWCWPQCGSGRERWRAACCSCFSCGCSAGSDGEAGSQSGRGEARPDKTRRTKILEKSTVKRTFII